MNKLFLFLFLSSILLSCTDSGDRMAFFEVSGQIITKSYGQVDYENYCVRESDIESYVYYIESIRNNSKGHVVEVVPVQHMGETVYYIINFDNGWQLVSADKRGPIVLADGKEGAFSLDTANEGVLSWINVLVDDIEYRRFCADDYYDNARGKIEDKEQYCLDTWKAITADADFITSQTKTKDHELQPGGHYELDYTYLTTEVRDSVTHLMTTLWEQGSPFNDYIPFESGSISDRCPAGCVAIATAQVFHYLHDFLGAPQVSPTSGYCYGDENNYSYAFYNYASSTWSNMQNTTDSLHFAALLIGDIAHRLETDFGAAGSSAYMYKIKTKICPPHGIDCTHSFSYDASTVYQNLCDSLPVIFGGNYCENLFEWPGHTFVIDGYDNIVTVTHYVYKWVIDSIPDPEGGELELPVPIPIGGGHPYEEITVSSPVMRHFFMNWGWGEAYEDNTSYSTNGYWSYGNDPVYQYNREMVYDFEITQ